MTDNKDKLAIDGGTPVRTEPFAPWPIIDERDEAAVLRVLRSGNWGWHGEETPAFEAEFAQAQGVAHAVSVSSGSAALEASLYAVGVRTGDEVIVPPYTFLATASTVLMRSAIPIFADIERATWNIDPVDIERKITSRTKAIIPVHIGGCPANMDAINAVAKKHGIPVIEDAAQAHGATWRGRGVGAIGDIGCFSFQASKNINSGEGGAVTSDNKELIDLAWSFKNYGRDRENMVWYGHDRLGTNLRMTDFQAGLLRTQLERLEDWSTRRTKNAEYLSAAIAPLGLTPQHIEEGVTRHVYHVYIAHYNAARFGGRDRDWFCEAMKAEGITCNRGYAPLYNQLGVRNTTHELLGALGRETSEAALGWTTCPVTEELCEQTVWLSAQHELLGTIEDMDDIVKAIEKIQRATQ